ncbi:MAG: arginine deiminase-related protein [Flavobacteriaceae bacterium]
MIKSPQILMIRPRKLREEFDQALSQIKDAGIEVYCYNQSKDTHSEMAFCCRSWISTKSDGGIIIYPLKEESRRDERQEELISFLEGEGFELDHVTDYSGAEDYEEYLEGECSMVLDRDNEIAFASIGGHSTEELFIEFCEDQYFFPVLLDTQEDFINSILSIGKHFAIVCLELIQDKKQRKSLLNQLKSTGREPIVISQQQVKAYCGEVVFLPSKNDEILLMSSTAYNQYTSTQLEQLNQKVNIQILEITQLEKLSSKSIGSMISEIRLKNTKNRLLSIVP